MDNDLISLVNLIIKKQYVSLNDIQTSMNITYRQATYRIDKLNEICKINHEKLITFTSGKNKQLIIPDKTKDFLSSYILNNQSNEEYILGKKERLIFMYLMMFVNPEYLSLNDFMSALNVSRSSVLLDLKDLSQEIEPFDVEVCNDRTKGYFLKGKEMNIRKVMMRFVIYSLAENHNSNVFDEFIEYKRLDIFEYSRLVISELASKHHIRFVEDRLTEFIYIFIFLKARILSGITFDSEINEKMEIDALKSMKEYEFTCELIRNYKRYEEISPSEINYIASWILGISFGDINEPTKDCLFISDLVGKIMERFATLSGSRYSNSEDIFIQLYSHFRPAYYRLIFSLPILNPLTDRVKEEFGQLYKLVEETMKPFNVIIGGAIPDDEIAYLTMHFAVIYFDKKQIEFNRQKIALVACSNGIGSSAILYNELTGMFPELHFLPPIEISQVNDYLDKVDLIFATNNLNDESKVNVPIIKVKPVMNLNERYQVLKEVYMDLGNGLLNYQPNVDTIIDIVSKYTTIKDKDNLYKDLVKYFTNFNENKIEVSNDDLYLNDLVKEELITLNIKAKDWKEAISKAYEPLIDNGYISENYKNETISSIETNGPYIVITKHIALAHCKPEAGALKTGMGICVLDKPVKFNAGDNDPVKYIFSLSVNGQKKHIKAMGQLIELFNDSIFFDILDNTKDAKEIIDYINK